MFGPLGTDKYREYAATSTRAANTCSTSSTTSSTCRRSRPAASGSTASRSSSSRPRRRHAGRVGPRRRQAAHAHRADRAAASGCKADRRPLKQIVLNLLSNAVKFTPEGGRVTVRARAARRLRQHRGRRHRHRHPEGRAAQLGRPFEQVESQLTKSHQGSGLGLAIAQVAGRAARRHDAHPLDAWAKAPWCCCGCRSPAAPRYARTSPRRRPKRPDRTRAVATKCGVIARASGRSSIIPPPTGPGHVVALRWERPVVTCPRLRGDDSP